MTESQNFAVEGGRPLVYGPVTHRQHRHQDFDGTYPFAATLGADSIGKFVRIFAGWDHGKRFDPMTEGEIIAYIDSPSVVVRDRAGRTQAYPVTLPVEEMS